MLSKIRNAVIRFATRATTPLIADAMIPEYWEAHWRAKAARSASEIVPFIDSAKTYQDFEIVKILIEVHFILHKYADMKEKLLQRVHDRRTKMRMDYMYSLYSGECV